MKKATISLGLLTNLVVDMKSIPDENVHYIFPASGLHSSQKDIRTSNTPLDDDSKSLQIEIKNPTKPENGKKKIKKSKTKKSFHEETINEQGLPIKYKKVPRESFDYILSTPISFFVLANAFLRFI